MSRRPRRRRGRNGSGAGFDAVSELKYRPGIGRDKNSAGPENLNFNLWFQALFPEKAVFVCLQLLANRAFVSPCHAGVRLAGGMETPVAFLLDSVSLFALRRRSVPHAARRRRESSVHWPRLIALGANLALWAVIIAIVRLVLRHHF